jgi:hypothetical protein
MRGARYAAAAHGAENILLKFIVNNDDDDDEVTASLSTPARTVILTVSMSICTYTHTRIASARASYRGYDLNKPREFYKTHLI